MLKIGLIGCGQRGRAHLETLAHLSDIPCLPPIQYADDSVGAYQRYANVPEWLDVIQDYEVTITDVVDPAADARQQAASIVSASGPEPAQWESTAAFLDGSDADAVVLATPNHTHVEQATELLDHDYDVYCEKPIATTIEGHDRLESAAAPSDGLLYVGFNLRASPAYRRYKKMIEEGQIGDLGMISAQNVRFPFPAGFRYQQGTSGGSLLEKNCHDFDLFNWFTESEPHRVAAMGGQQVLDRDTDVIDHATVQLEYESGVKATLELCLYTPFTQQENRRIAIRGTDAIAAETDDGEIRVNGPGETATIEQVGTEYGHGGADIRVLSRFLACLRGEAEPPASIADARAAARIAFTAEAAIEDGDVKYF
jgi:predicted dehydrogenase